MTISDSVRGTLNFLASAGPLANTTVSGDEADEVMLQTGGQILGCGVLYYIKSKKLSPKVYHLSLESAN